MLPSLSKAVDDVRRNLHLDESMIDGLAAALNLDKTDQRSRNSLGIIRVCKAFNDAQVRLQMSVVLTTSVVTDSITHQMLGNDCVRASMYDIVWPATSAIVNSQRTFTEMLLDFQSRHIIGSC